MKEDGFRRLSLAVLHRAIDDAKGGEYIPLEDELTAREFLARGERDRWYALYTSMAGIPSDCTGERLERIVDAMM